LAIAAREHLQMRRNREPLLLLEEPYLGLEEVWAQVHLL